MKRRSWLWLGISLPSLAQEKPTCKSTPDGGEICEYSDGRPYSMRGPWSSGPATIQSGLSEQQKLERSIDLALETIRLHNAIISNLTDRVDQLEQKIGVVKG